MLETHILFESHSLFRQFEQEAHNITKIWNFIK